jgi:5-methylcytosine-specific restriction endonuclease McrA
MNEPVLVLNRNFEPINVCNTQRAVGLLMVGKAEIVENGRGYIRTASSVFPRPSVIRLSIMIHRPRPCVKLTKREVFRRDNYTCQYCGQIVPRLTVDHIIPRFRGGEYSWENLVTACPQCNRHKGGRTLQEAHMTLLHRPQEPVSSAGYLYGRHLRDSSCAEWGKYLEGW